jgi:hypothetical protein
LNSNFYCYITILVLYSSDHNLSSRPWQLEILNKKKEHESMR